MRFVRTFRVIRLDRWLLIDTIAANSTTWRFCPQRTGMAKSEIPADVRRFILTSISSVPHLEALMLIRGTSPRQWTPKDIAARLYVPPAVAESVLTDLCSSGMLVCDESGSLYAYGTRPEPVCDVIDSLAALYGSHLVEITLLIHSKLDRKAQQFADAFNFRKES